jgi:HTH-type transcriptional regulator/antitoxin HigA
MTKTVGSQTAKKKLDPEKYSALLSEVQPVNPTSPAEHKRLREMLEELMEKLDATAEEKAMIGLLATLVSTYERKKWGPGDAEPLELLEYLMEEHGLKQKDLIAEFGTASRVSEALSGKRPITKSQAAALGKRFHVTPSVFLEL